MKSKILLKIEEFLQTNKNGLLLIWRLLFVGRKHSAKIFQKIYRRQKIRCTNFGT